MNRITAGPAWLEFIAILFVEIDWRKAGDFATLLVAFALVTLAAFGTVGTQIITWISLAFPQFQG